jgi:hypothetical protein
MGCAKVLSMRIRYQPLDGHRRSGTVSSSWLDYL